MTLEPEGRGPMDINRFVSSFLNWLLGIGVIWFVWKFNVPIQAFLWIAGIMLAIVWLCRHKPIWAFFFLGFVLGLLG